MEEDISGSVLNIFFELEKPLNHVRKARLLKGVHERVESLINDKIMVPIGEWEAKKDEFIKDRTPGNEKFYFSGKLFLIQVKQPSTPRYDVPGWNSEQKIVT